MISVIIPVYNTEKYIKKCIDSVTTQTYRNLEIIIIDDGSKDRSLDICQEMAKNDSRIRVFHQENKGVSSARNKGLDYATGDWISFLDSDDYLDRDFYETLINATSSNVSIICCGVRPVNEKGEEVPHLQYNNIPKEDTLLSGKDVWMHFLHPSKRYLYWSPWDKLISTVLAKKHRFVVGRKFGEDLYYCFQCLKDTESIYYIPQKKYNYLIREGSATHSNSFNYSSFDSLFVSKKIFLETRNEQSLKHYTRLNMLVVAARIVRGYYLHPIDRRQYGLKIKQIRKLIRKQFRLYCIVELNIKHLCLILAAAYMPTIFKIR